VLVFVFCVNGVSARSCVQVFMCVCVCVCVFMCVFVRVFVCKTGLMDVRVSLCIYAQKRGGARLLSRTSGSGASGEEREGGRSLRRAPSVVSSLG
jgi:hypothetical protein